MENCLYRGNTICTFDLKDDKDLYYEEMVLDWKQAAAERKLTCLECGAHVYLAAGSIKEPYFAHYDLEECDYGNGHESEELKKGKRLLYQLLRRSFPTSDIQARFRMENGLYSTLYCIFEHGQAFSVDYRLQNNSLEKFRERDAFYQFNRITPIYVLGKRLEKEGKQLDWYQNLLQSSMGYLIYLDTKEETLTLKKSFGYRLGNSRKFQYLTKTYPICELTIRSDGQMSGSFTQECERVEQQIMEEKLQYQRRLEQLKRLREEQLRHEEEDRRRQEEYRRTKEREKNREEHSYAEQHPKFQDLNPALLEKCRRMIEEGNGNLVSKKYYDAIMEQQNTD